MNVIMINGASCSGKSTISKEICRLSNNSFVHLQVDKVGMLLGTIFPKGFSFAKNEEGTEGDDDGLKGLFNNNRFARRKVACGLLLSVAKELLVKDFNVVIDTALDGPDAKILAQEYKRQLKDYQAFWIGIDCSLEEKLKRLKTRTDNLFLTEEFIKMQHNQNIFGLVKEFYHKEFDSSNKSAIEIAKEIFTLVSSLAF